VGKGTGTREGRTNEREKDQKGGKGKKGKRERKGEKGRGNKKERISMKDEGISRKEGRKCIPMSRQICRSSHLCTNSGGGREGRRKEGRKDATEGKNDAKANRI
jgi:hypothetical protein